jgi:hypothetical protein
MVCGTVVRSTGALISRLGMGAVKYATAVRQLVSVAEAATADAQHLPTDGEVLRELWVGGRLLDGPDELETTDLVLVLDEPVDELPWNALHPTGTWLAHRLRLDRLPILWHLRPIGYPAWNPLMRSVVRLWSAREGLDQDVVDGLRERRLAALPVVSPSDAELSAQLTVELAVCWAHLRQTLDGYWEPSWRRDARAKGGAPDDHLWRAAEAVREMADALAQLSAEAQP